MFVHCCHLESMKCLTVILHTSSVETLYFSIWVSACTIWIKCHFYINSISLVTKRTSDQHPWCCLVSTDPWVGYSERCLNLRLGLLRLFESLETSISINLCEHWIISSLVATSREMSQWGRCSAIALYTYHHTVRKQTRKCMCVCWRRRD